MKIQLAQTLRDYDKKNLPKDMFAGLIIMAVSIPISMEYAQFTACMDRYSLFFCLPSFPHRPSSFLAWMRLRRHWSDRRCLVWG